MGQSFLIHAAARVLDGKHDVAAAFEIETGRSGFFEMYICGLDLELPAFRHRIQGVDDEIHQHLFDLAFVGFDAQESVAEIEDQFDIFADERLKHDVHVADDGIQVEYLRLENLFAPKSHQLPRHRCRLLRRIVDQEQLRPHGVVAAQAAEKNFAASDDDGKKIVEVMGDTAGQSSNRLHLVSRADLFLEAPSLFLSPITLTDLVAKNFVGPREGCGAALHAQFELVGCAAQLFFEALSLSDVANVQEQGGLTQIFDAARSNGVSAAFVERVTSCVRRSGGTRSDTFLPMMFSRVVPCSAAAAGLQSRTFPARSSMKIASGELSNSVWKRGSRSRIPCGVTPASSFECMG